MKHMIAEVGLHRYKLPTGKFLAVNEQVTRSVNGERRQAVAYVLISEDTATAEMMSGDFQGMDVIHFRVGDPITEDKFKLLGAYLGNAAGFHFFELKVPA